MNQEPIPPYELTRIPTPPKRTFWQKFGGGSLSISLFLHLVLLAVGVIWVLKIVPAEDPKVVDFMPRSGGGGPPSSETMARKQRLQMTQPNLSRVVALNSLSTIAMPEPDELQQMTSLSGMSSGSLSAGLGGTGTGGGKGPGDGPGIGSGTFPGLSTGTGNKNPFGMLEMSTGGLAGTFYDLKQTTDMKATDMTDSGFREVLKEIVGRGLKERDLANYYKAPSTLYQTKFMIPRMSADLAPAAFDVEKFVQPRRWLVVYRGEVKAPQSGRFRFVGAGDDVLLVRFNKRLVFDYGYTLSTTGGGVATPSQANYDKNKKSDEIREFKRLSPMPVPTINYQYGNTPTINAALGGLAVGPEFQVTAGATYPIEILISEIPGGLFSTALLIEEKGTNYQKDATGSPILPLFRLDGSQPDPEMNGEFPPFAPEGPIWKSTGSSPTPDI